MRKYLFITMCAFLSLWAGKVSAQRYLPGQTGLELRLGGVDDFGKNVRHLRGNFQVGMALSRYNRNRSRWVVGADYVKKHYAYKETAVPKEQFTAEAGCLFPFLSDRGRNVFLSAGLSALAGYERVNRNGRLLYDGATLLHKGAFIYGFAPAFEMEAFLSDRLVFLFNVRQRIFFGSSVGNFHTAVSSTFLISGNSMEQGNWNVDEMLHWLDMKINREDRDIREQSKKMNENFLHFFEWNAESLYKSHFMSGCYKILRQAVDGAKDMDTVRNIVEDNIAYCESKLLNGQVDCNSSSRTTNVAYFLKLECMQQLVRDYREFANILAQTPPEENLQQTANKTEKKREEPPERKIKTGIRR